MYKKSLSECVCWIACITKSSIVSNAGTEKGNVLCIERKKYTCWWMKSISWCMYVKKAHVSLNSMMNSFIQNE